MVRTWKGEGGESFKIINKNNIKFLEFMITLNNFQDELKFTAKNLKIYIRDKRLPIPASDDISFLMSKIKRKNTSPEILIKKELQKKVLWGYRIHLTSLPGTPDISYKNKKVAIFVNGYFWHGCPCCKLKKPKSNQIFWEENLLKNKERDEKNLNALKELGWKTIVIWECQIKENLENQIQEIISIIKKEN